MLHSFIFLFMFDILLYKLYNLINLIERKKNIQH